MGLWLWSRQERLDDLCAAWVDVVFAQPTARKNKQRKQRAPRAQLTMLTPATVILG